MESRTGFKFCQLLVSLVSHDQDGERLSWEEYGLPDVLPRAGIRTAHDELRPDIYPGAARSTKKKSGEKKRKDSQ